MRKKKINYTGPHPETRLTEYRLARGWSIDDVAMELGVNRSTVFRWETGKNPIPPVSLTALGRLYEIEPYMLMKGTEQFSPQGMMVLSLFESLSEEHRKVALQIFLTLAQSEEESSE